MTTPPPQIGRTPSDLVVHFFTSWRAMLVAMIVLLLTTVLAVVLIWILTDRFAKTGSTVNVFWGAVQYQKKGSDSTQTLSLVAEKSRQILWFFESETKPRNGYLAMTSDFFGPTPILDGTISIWSTDKDFFVGGLNIGLISIAARSSAANFIEPQRILKLYSGEAVAPHVVVPKCANGCVVEIRYRDVLLHILIEEDRRNDNEKKRTTSYALIEPIEVSTLELQPYSSLKALF